MEPSTEHAYILRFICCGRDDGSQVLSTWEEADANRNSYCEPQSYPFDGHERSAIITKVQNNFHDPIHAPAPPQHKQSGKEKDDV